MFHFIHGRARLEKGRPNRTRLAVEELARRDVPAAFIGPTVLTHAAAAAAASSNGASAATQMPAIYDGTQVTVNIKEQPDKANASLIGHNQSINTIYAYADLDEEQPFAPVLDAIQGDGFNPLWHQVLIQFNQGFTPHQFASDDEVLAAAQAGEITLITTDEVYICAVVRGTGQNA